MPQWNEATRTSSGAAKVAGGEPYRLILALNGWKLEDGQGVEALGAGLAVVTLRAEETGVVPFAVRFAGPAAS